MERAVPFGFLQSPSLAKIYQETKYRQSLVDQLIRTNSLGNDRWQLW